MAVCFRALKGSLNCALGTVKTSNIRSHTGLLTLSAATPCNCYVTLTSSQGTKVLARHAAVLPQVLGGTSLQSTCQSSSICLPAAHSLPEVVTNDVIAPELVNREEQAPFTFFELRSGDDETKSSGVVCRVPTTVLSGYLDAYPYKVYCFDVDRRVAAEMALSDYEREVLQFAGTSVALKGAGSNEQLPDPGRATEEQLKRISRALARHLPRFFTEPHIYNVYNRNIVFRNNIRGITTRGITSYVQQMALVRILGHLRYAHVQLEVLKMTTHKEDSTVRIRWRIVGVSGLRALFMFWKFRIWEWQKMISQEAEWTDGFSVLKVGSDGLIYEHICDKMMPDEELEEVKSSNVAVKLALLLGLTPQSFSFGSPTVVSSSENSLL
ncbi:uncharacterized protein LOC119436349 [Dermacentor silvarum]|uniref:uncharacterized protein LOC119436349 n=1 Tax=Dermacentor silvarum TaxID=543639 RepID=UPI0018995431|nr:uncharacterized protein LOC119436349 [Dermacentor silvarum]